MIGLLFVFLEVRVYVSNTFCVDTTSRSDVTGPHTVPPPFHRPSPSTRF